jgi:hypothetical protein
MARTIVLGLAIYMTLLKTELGVGSHIFYPPLRFSAQGMEIAITATSLSRLP